MPHWLLEKEALEALNAFDGQAIEVSAEQHEKYLLAAELNTFAVESGESNKALINVEGLLTSKLSIFAIIFGGGSTTYPGIRAAIAAAEADSNIEEIVLSFNSPGGHASADLIETMNAIKNTSKPTRAIVRNMAASAAFGLAVQADTIEAANELSIVGSVGTVTTRRVDKGTVTITSSNAPKKAPDVSTPEGVRAVQETIDKIEAVFIDHIASGRATTAENVKENFGRGDIVLAKEAIAKGMIDSISDQPKQTQVAAVIGDEKEESNNMDRTKLIADHPELYQAVMEEGAGKERSRVNAHLKMAKAHNAMDIAQAAIADGKSIQDDEVMADYLTAKAGTETAEKINAGTKETEAALKDVTKKEDDKETEAEAIADDVFTALGGVE